MESRQVRHPYALSVPKHSPKIEILKLKTFVYLVSIQGLGATLNVAKPKKGSTVAVFGLGAVGLAVRLTILLVLAHIHNKFFLFL